MPTDVLREEVQHLVASGAQLVEVLAAEEYRQEHIAGALSLRWTSSRLSGPKASCDATGRWSSTATTGFET